MKHVYREHNQEADHWADIGAQGRRKIEIYRKNVPTTWKAIRGFWDGSFRNEQPLRDRAGLQQANEQCQQQAGRTEKEDWLRQSDNEDQHTDEWTVSKEQLLSKIENSTCQSLCDKQRRPRRCLEAQQLQFIEFSDKTTESQS